VLSLNKIAIRRGRKLLIENVSFQAHAGQRMGLIGANGSGKSSLFAMLLGELEADDGELGISAKDQIAHVAQESPNSTASGLDYVMDGDSELREVQAAIAAEESSGEEHSANLHTLYERMEHIDGFTAEARAAKLLHGLGFIGDAIHKPVPLGHTAARRADQSPRSSCHLVAGALAKALRGNSAGNFA